MKLTPWYPPEIKPVRKGVYEVQAEVPPWFRYWNGHEWSYGAESPDMVPCRMLLGPSVYEYWRGLAETPR